MKYLSKAVIVIMMILMTNAYSRDMIGVRAGTYTDADEIFIGGEYLGAIGAHTYLNPNIEYIFLENTTFMTFNFDVHYDFAETSRTMFWGGAGLGVQYFDWEGKDNSNTEAGLNILFGAGLKTTRNVVPYIQGKFVIGDYDDFVLGLGIRF